MPVGEPTFIGGEPPGPHAGTMSPRTEELRPAIQLTREQAREARRLGRLGMHPTQVAEHMAEPISQVSLAMATLRTRRADPPRASLNITMEAREWVGSQAYIGEPLWQTTDRLLHELAIRRALMP